MKGFNEKTLGEIVMFQRGFDITKKGQSPGIVPIVSSSGISSYHNQSKVEAPGVVIGRKGTLGTVHHITQDFWPHDTTLWVKDFKGNDPRFIYYFLKTLHLDVFDTGSSNPTLNRNHVHKIKVLFPEKNIQNKIAAILSAYDDLIENNKRRIALLENMAEEIYREWFVRFRFPGYQTAEFEKGIPKGWDVKELSDTAKINSSNLKKNDASEYLEYIDIGSVTTNNIGESVIYHRDEAPGRAKRLVKHGDIIWSSVRPGNRAYSLIFRPNKNLVVSTGFAVITPIQEEYYPFIYQVTTTDSFVDQITAVAKGAAYPATSFDDYGKTNILMPDDKLVREYFRSCNPIYEEIFVLKSMNSKLNNSKNMLLPRLISGKLSVEKLDIQFPPSMQQGVS